MRGKAFRKHHELRVIHKRISIVKNVYHQSKEDMKQNSNWNKQHKLSKHKVHCSCPMCSTKTKRDGYKHSDKVKLEKGDDRGIWEYIQ